MIGMGENQLGAQAVRASLLDFKTLFTIGIVGTCEQGRFDTSRTMQVTQEIQNYKLSRYISSGSVNSAKAERLWTDHNMGTEEIILFTGRDDKQPRAEVAPVLTV